MSTRKNVQTYWKVVTEKVCPPEKICPKPNEIVCKNVLNLLKSMSIEKICPKPTEIVCQKWPKPTEIVCQQCPTPPSNKIECEGAEISILS